MEPVNEAPQRRELGEVWPELEPHLRRSLSSAPPHVVDDVLQETSIKLLRIWDTIDHDRPTLPLAVTIARNALRDELRKSARHSHDELSEEARVGDDLDATVSARIELARVGAEITRLTPGQRAALLTEVGAAPRSPDTPRVKMLRARARRRLRELVAQAGGFVTTGVARLRSAASGRAAAAAPDLGVLAQALLIAVVATGSSAVITGSRPTAPAEPPVARVASATRGAAEAAEARRDATTGPEASHGGVARPQAPVASSETRHDEGGAPGGHGLPTPPLPKSQGEATDGSYLGTEGYSMSGGAGTTTEGHDVAYRYEGEWETPGCVQRLAEGQAPGRCEAPERPSMTVEVEVDGQRHRVSTEGRRRR
jgi:hypothetical protein